MEEVKCYDTETGKESVESPQISAYDGKSNDAAAADHHKPVIDHGKLRRSTGPARRSSKANWTEEEDDILRDAVQKYEGKCWKKIAECLPGRTDVQCLHRWQKVLKPDLVKGPWSKEEDSLLIELVGKLSEKKWSEIAEQLPGRMGKQCRERWYNHLKPDINKAAWTDEEEKILINSHAMYGSKWSILAKLLPGRTENSVKNHWNCSLKKKLGNYSASGSAAYHPPFTIPALHGDNKGMAPEFIEEKQNLSTYCLCKERVNTGSNGESSSLNLVLGCSGNLSRHPSSSGNAKNSLRSSPSTCSKVEINLDNLSKTLNYAASNQTKLPGCTSVDENGSSHGTHDYSHKPFPISSVPTEILLPYPALPLPRCNDRDLIISCSITPRQHSDISDKALSSSDWSYTGLCYEPIQKADLNIFLSTGKFPSTESYIRQLNRSVSAPPSRSHMKTSPDFYSSAKSILRSAAMSYNNMPAIIRKRAIKRSQKGVSTLDKVVGSLSRTQAMHEVPKVDDDQVQALLDHVFFCPKCQKLEKLAAIRSVGQCLEREFSDA